MTTRNDSTAASVTNDDKPADELFAVREHHFRMMPPGIEYLSFMDQGERGLKFVPEMPQGDNYGVGNLVGTHAAHEFLKWCKFQGSFGTHTSVASVIEVVLAVLSKNNPNDPRRGAAVGFRDVLVDALIGAATRLDIDALVASSLARSKKFYDSEHYNELVAGDQ